MSIAVLYPNRAFRIIGAKVASWQTRSRLRRGDDVAAVVYYDEDEPAEDVISGLAETFALVVIDPLVTVHRDTAARLRSELEHSGAAAVGVSSPDGSLALYLCPLETLRHERRPPASAIDGDRCLKSTSVAFATWQRDEPPDLLPFVPATAARLLHVGCGDGALGERIRRRQRCRVVGIETDGDQARAAKRRLDDVYTGDFEQIISILQAEFDCVIVTGVLEHVTDPWSLLGGLLRAAVPGGGLVAALPNVANAQVVADLVKGAFDTARQERFFTRRSIEELVDIAGWRLDRIDAAATFDENPLVDPSSRTLPGAAVDATGDLQARWFTVVAHRPAE